MNRTFTPPLGPAVLERLEAYAEEFVAQGRRCSRCGRERAYKGHHAFVFRTPFGKVEL
jgi:hypothetical protein